MANSRPIIARSHLHPGHPARLPKHANKLSKPRVPRVLLVSHQAPNPKLKENPPRLSRTTQTPGNRRATVSPDDPPHPTPAGPANKGRPCRAVEFCAPGRQRQPPGGPTCLRWRTWLLLSLSDRCSTRVIPAEETAGNTTFRNSWEGGAPEISAGAFSGEAFLPAWGTRNKDA